MRRGKRGAGSWVLRARKEQRIWMPQATISVHSPHLAFRRWPQSKLPGRQPAVCAVPSPVMLFIPWKCYWWHRNQVPVQAGNTSEEQNPALWQKQDSLSALSLPTGKHPPHFCSTKTLIQHQDSAEGMEQGCRAGGTMSLLLLDHTDILWFMSEMEKRRGPPSPQDLPALRMLSKELRDGEWRLWFILLLDGNSQLGFVTWWGADV